MPQGRDLIQRLNREAESSAALASSIELKREGIAEEYDSEFQAGRLRDQVRFLRDLADALDRSTVGPLLDELAREVL